MTAWWREDRWSQVECRYCPVALRRFFTVTSPRRAFPDPTLDTFITLEGKEVSVPQGKPVDQPQYTGSHFSNSEYLIYKESQCRLRYLLELHMD